MKAKPLDLTRLEERRKLQCKRCGEQKEITCRSLQYEHLRHCNACGYEWSGGMNRGIPDPLSVPVIPGIAEPEDDDRPVVQYTGANFRDPNKQYGGF